jgi:type II secretory ATPase GspE/PulE/Tfp pilus assembly ATPase PilB-like protein
MTCEEARERMAAYAYGQLEPEMKEKMDAHLSECEACRDELAALRQVLALTKIADNVSIAGLAIEILRTAIERKASDIHIERERMHGSPRVRYRIDGALQLGPKIAEEHYEPLISRIKVMAEMNVVERSLPQDGRIPMRFNDKEFELRVSMFPYVTGESAVMRILDRSNLLIGLDRLGMPDDIREKVESLASQPNGLLVVTGPTGSGKTTTLYSILQKLNRAETKIMTIEDPVEYLLPGVNQGHVNPKRGLTFSAGLRALMRQDPDIMMVGEIRDQETLEIAIQASLTGHLVLTTLHTHDTTEAIRRLTDILPDAYLIADSLIGVLAQRLIRTICPNCKTPYAPSLAESKRLGFTEAEQPQVLYRGAGCETCRGTGFKGRTGLYERLLIDSQLGEMIRDRASEPKMRAYALEAGLLAPFSEDARFKAKEGITTFAEVERALATLL